VLVVTAKTEGVWGNGLRLVVDYNTPNPDDTFNLQVIHEEAGTVVAEEAFSSDATPPAVEGLEQAAPSSRPAPTGSSSRASRSPLRCTRSVVITEWPS
jgi:hypothetical protein